MMRIVGSSSGSSGAVTEAVHQTAEETLRLRWDLGSEASWL